MAQKIDYIVISREEPQSIRVLWAKPADEGGELELLVFISGKWRTFRGDDGKSAYDLALENGFEGTLEEWLESQKGPKGDDGEPGAPLTYEDLTAAQKAELAQPAAEQAALAAQSLATIQAAIEDLDPSTSTEDAITELNAREISHHEAQATELAALGLKVDQHDELLAELDEIVNGETTERVTRLEGTANTYYNTNAISLGDTFTKDAAALTNCTSYKINVLAGEKYVIKGYGSDQVGQYVLVNSNNVIVDLKTRNYDTDTPVEVEVENDGILYVNDYNAAGRTGDYVDKHEYITGDGALTGRVRDLETDVSSLQASVQTKIGDAPSDGEQYARTNNGWAKVDVAKFLDGEYYQKALDGFSFGDSAGDLNFKTCIKAIWIKNKTASELSGTLKLVYFGSNSSNSVFTLSTTNNDVKYSLYKTKQTGVQTYEINQYDEPLASTLYVTIDWDKANAYYTTGLTTTLDLSKIPIAKQEDTTIREQIDKNAKCFYGKTIVCFGDSITEYIDNDGLSYSDHIGLLSGAKVYNCGVGGSQLRQRATPTASPSNDNEAYACLDIVNMIKAACDDDWTYQEAAATYLKNNSGDDNTLIIARAKTIDWTKVDVVTIFGGTNDWNNASSSWGDETSTSVSTTCGAIKDIIQRLLTTYPHIKVYWFTPIVRWMDYSANPDAEKFSDIYQRNNTTLKQFSAMIFDLVGSYHIPVCDMYNTLGWNQYNFSNYFTTPNDGTHPKNGYKNIAKKFIGFLSENRTF